MKTMKMEVPADLRFVPGVRNGIARMACNFGFNDCEAYQIETIVDEICNNAIEYGSKNKEAVIKIECKFDKEKIEMIVKDSGNNKFNVEETFNRNIELMKQEQDEDSVLLRRGRGLIIVKNLADKLNIRVGSKGTTVKIVKKKTCEEK